MGGAGVWEWARLVVGYPMIRWARGPRCGPLSVCSLLLSQMGLDLVEDGVGGGRVGVGAPGGGPPNGQVGEGCSELAHPHTHCCSQWGEGGHAWRLAARANGEQVLPAVWPPSPPLLSPLRPRAKS